MMPAGAVHAPRLRREMKPRSPRFAYAVTDAPLADYGTGLIAGQATRFLDGGAGEGALRPVGVCVRGRP